MRASAYPLASIIIKQFEGCALHSYVLEGEHWPTIGYGHAFDMAHHPKTISQAEADATLIADMARKDADLCREIPGEVLQKLTDDEYAAILSFRFNVLPAAWLSPNCNTRKFLRAGNLVAFRAKLKEWRKGGKGGNEVMGGLQRRRKCERFVLAGHKVAELPGVNFFQNNYKADNY